jgi:hypothetical protein
MTKTISLTISLAVAVLGFAAAAAPTQAATRLMSSSLDGFEYRCEHHGGIFAQDGSSASCQTPTVPVACDYFDTRQAVCTWPGIENQIAVIRVIGTLPAGYAASVSDDGGSDGATGGNGGGNGNGGGFQGPNDIKDAPNNDPKPNFDGPKDFQMAP